MKPLRWVRGLCLLLLAIMLVASACTLGQWRFDSNILALFPNTQNHSGQARADALLSSKVERKVLLLVSADSSALVRAQLPALRDSLLACQCFTQVKLKASDQGVNLGALYAAHTPALLAKTTRTLLRSGKADVLVQQQLQRIFTQPGSLSAASLSADPLGSLHTFQASAQRTTGQLRIDSHGYLFIKLSNRRYFLVRATLAGSPYQVDLQKRAAASLDHALAPLKKLSGADIKKTGALFYTLAGTEQAQREVSTVGVGSILGIILLLLIVFRQPLLVVLAFLPIAAGVLAGLTVTFWVFGAVHIVALVFGAALVGVAIDYSLHFFAKRMLAGHYWRANEGTQRLLAPLGLGLLTSVAGYMSFTAAGFPGFTQVAVLSSAGLIAAFAVVVGVYPWLLARAVKRPTPAWLERGLGHWQRGHARWLALLTRPWVLALIAVMVVVALSQWRTNDDIRQMQLPAQKLTQMQAFFRSHLGATTALQYILVRAANADTLLQRQEKIQQRLAPVIASGALAGTRSLADFIPSQKRQQRNMTLWQNRVIGAGVLDELLQQLQVTAKAQTNILARANNVQPLTFASAWPLLKKLNDAPVYFVNNAVHYGAMSVRGLTSPEAVRRALKGISYASWVDPVARTNHLLRHYRRAALVLLFVAYGGIAIILAWRYSARGALAVIAPPALASVVSLALLVAIGQALSVFHIMALLLVLGIGVDYTLFLREGSTRLDTLLAIVLSTLTTVLSFGLLALSATAAIANFGLTVLLGIVLAFLLAPLAQKKSREIINE